MVRVEELNTRSRVHFSTSLRSVIHIRHTRVGHCFSEPFEAPRGVCGLAIDLHDRHSGHTATATVPHICVYISSRSYWYSRDASRPEPWMWWRERSTQQWKDHGIMRCEHCWPTWTRPETTKRPFDAGHAPPLFQCENGGGLPHVRYCN